MSLWIPVVGATDASCSTVKFMITNLKQVEHPLGEKLSEHCFSCYVVRGITYRAWPIMLKCLPIILLNSAQKGYPLCSILCSYITTAIMLQSIHNFVIFTDYIRIVRLQPVVLCCSALIFDVSCSMLRSWEKLCLILYHIGMITIKFYKDWHY